MELVTNLREEDAPVELVTNLREEVAPVEPIANLGEEVAPVEPIANLREDEVAPLKTRRQEKDDCVTEDRGVALKIERISLNTALRVKTQRSHASYRLLTVLFFPCGFDGFDLFAGDVLLF